MTPGDATAPPLDEPKRDLAIFLRVFVSLTISLTIVRAFLFEPSHVPTGSMAPHRLGDHLSYVCQDCDFEFAVGIGVEGVPARPICPNCGSRRFDGNVEPSVRSGDRIWIDKSCWNLSAPGRWDEVVFYAPGSPLTPHLKRVVGLPGEKVRIADGDVFAGGVRLRKSEIERKRMSVLVFDMTKQAKEGVRPGRWRFEVENPSDSYASTRWMSDRNSDAQTVLRIDPPHEVRELGSAQPLDWLNYRHFCPILDDYGPVRDFLSYDGPDDGQGHVVGDLWFSALIKWQTDPERDPAIQFRLTTPETDIRVTLQELVERQRGENWGAYLGRIMIDGVTIAERRISDRSTALIFAKFPGGQEVEMSWVDHRFEFRIAGRLIFAPFDLDDKPPRRPDERFRDSPVGFGVRGSSATVESFRLYRDIHYTNRLATEPVIGHGVREDVELPPDGYFVLGDDSAHSVDSRFFEAGPVVPRSAMIGRPIGQGKMLRP
ncbi:hypothetical protein GC170_18820 [bacterium]|nr:hypothetical protein [bacterium]